MAETEHAMLFWEREEREREGMEKKEFIENRDMEVLSVARISGDKYVF